MSGLDTGGVSLDTGSASVIVATYNRAPFLDECLAHLRRQPFLDGDELIVVDNGSTDETPAILARHAADFPVPLVRIVEPAPGKSRALAAALAVARGGILAFTDDDVIVAPDWLAEIRRALTADEADLVGGPVAPRWERPAPAWLRLQNDAGYGRLAAPLALLDYGPAPGVLGPRTLLGANLALRRDVLVRLGGFAPHLGKLRGTLLSGEDHDLCQRTQAAGFRARYLPAIRVRHWVPGDRMRLRYFVSWFYWSGVTHAILDRRDGATGPTLRTGMHLARRFIAGLSGAAVALARGRGPSAIERMLDAAFAAGYATRQCGFAVAPSHTGARTERAA